VVKTLKTSSRAINVFLSSEATMTPYPRLSRMRINWTYARETS
jgi:hypothetical protein